DELAGQHAPNGMGRRRDEVDGGPSATVVLAHDEVVEISTEVLALNEGLLKAGCGNKAVQALGKYEQPHAEQQLSHCGPPDNQVGDQRGGGKLGQYVPQLP